MAEEEKKERAKKEAAEAALMREEDSFSKKLELQARKLAKAAERARTRAETTERKKMAVLEKDANRRIRELNASQRLKRPRERNKRQSGSCPPYGETPHAQENVAPIDIGAPYIAQAVHVGPDPDIVVFACV
ncbi:hypothetical protein PHYPSEUDO_005623 [Phytophthora pseudosyringae]|uniref:Uncharacterized protein n=1 Tax=Phytophthora pseudosyringae TaxID=221518 RepID=A0A8T1VP53_9STRA|nr:hypothetical protein PHYPSEUDO_005623 [Phytophthora pseudosyringae]